MESILPTMPQMPSLLQGNEASAPGAGVPAAEVSLPAGESFHSLLASLAEGGEDADGDGWDWTAAGKDLVELLSHSKGESPEASANEREGVRSWVFSSEGQAALGKLLARIGALISQGELDSDSLSSGSFPRILPTSEDFPLIQLRNPGDRVVPAPNNAPAPSSAPFGSLVIENTGGKIELSWWRVDAGRTGEQAFLLSLTVDKGEGKPLIARMIVEAGVTIPDIEVGPGRSNESLLNNPTKQTSRMLPGNTGVDVTENHPVDTGTPRVSSPPVKGAVVEPAVVKFPVEKGLPAGKPTTLPIVQAGSQAGKETGKVTTPQIQEQKIPQVDQRVGILKEEAKTPESGVRVRIATRPGATQASLPATRTGIRLDEVTVAKTAESARVLDSLSFEVSGKPYRVLDVQGERNPEMLERDARADRTPLWLDRQAALERRRSRIELLPITRPELANGRFVFDFGGLEAARSRALDVPLRIAANEVYRAITEEIADMRRLSEGSRTIRLAVEPPHLGALSARIEISGNTLNLSLTVSAHAAREFLEGQLPHLKSSLENLGFELSEFGVEVDTGSDGRGDVYRWSDEGGTEIYRNDGSEGVEEFGDEPDGRLLSNRLYI